MTSSFRIGDRTIGPGNSCFIIAEIGTAHGGDLGKAVELIDAAAAAGADCAKFQIVYADEIIHPKTGLVRLPGGDVPLYERFRELEQDALFYARLKERTEARGMVFLCTPFGIRSARILEEIGVEAFKVASPELNHFPLLSELTSSDKPLILSSGVSKLADIEKALEICGSDRTALLHCITAYPAPEEEYNLKLLPLFSSLFGIPVGVSDHSKDPLLVPLLALLTGASIIEKHFTLENSGSGLDDPIALQPQDFARMTGEIRSAEREGAESVLGKLEETYDTVRISRVLGDGRKRLAPSERENYGRTNRSLHAVKDIPAGNVIDEGSVSLLRTEKILSPGLPPEFFPLILGKKTVRSISSGEGIQWEDLLISAEHS